MNTRIFSLLLVSPRFSCLDNQPRSEQDNDLKSGNYTRNDAPMTMGPEEKKGFWEEQPSRHDANQAHQLLDARTGQVVGGSQFPSHWKVIAGPFYTLDRMISAILIQFESVVRSRMGDVGPGHVLLVSTTGKIEPGTDVYRNTK